MCGLLGFVGPPAAAPSRERFQRGLATLARRGPDGEGTWFHPERIAALGHRRLAIVGVERGAQPLVSEDGRIVAVVNGEFYREPALRARLQAAGHVFATECDSELLVHLYEEQGEACLAELRGEFAFLLWDDRRRILWGARDRFGVKPLLYAPTADGGFWLGSQAKAFFAAGLPARWDRETAFHALSWQYPTPGRTFFERIRQVPPGCALRIEDGRSQVRPYWTWRPCRQSRTTESAPSFYDLALELKYRLARAVADRLRSERPLACQLSGGLDSSLVYALAARSGAVPAAFTLSFPHPKYDELPQAQTVAAHVGGEVQPVPAGAAALLAALPRAVEASEGWAVNGHLSAKYLLHQTISQAGFPVVLTGEGADEVFAGYPHFRPASASDPGHVSRGVMLPDGESLDVSLLKRRFGFVPGFLQAKATLGRKLLDVLRDDFVAAFRGIDPFAPFRDEVTLQIKPGSPRLRVEMQLWSRTAFAQYILRTLGDGTESAHGVEGRLPFLDEDLVAWAEDLSAADLLGPDGAQEKALLRTAGSDLLPPESLRRPKHPLAAPPLLGCGDPQVAELVRSRLSSEAASSQPFFDPRRARAWFGAAESLPSSMQPARDPVLWTLLSIVEMQETFRLT